MKKLALAAVVLGGLSLTSCNKCRECHYDAPDGTFIDIGELCGEELRNAEKDGYSLGDTLTVEIHCEDH
ncbi:MAG: hypothetical protein MK078_14790 [Crocinitomicaceae bacterium]|nr:hypothetical protein [Crocinitomicaceae bacterium]